MKKGCPGSHIRLPGQPFVCSLLDVFQLHDHAIEFSADLLF